MPLAGTRASSPTVSHVLKNILSPELDARCLPSFARCVTQSATEVWGRMWARWGGLRNVASNEQRMAGMATATASISSVRPSGKKSGFCATRCTASGRIKVSARIPKSASRTLARPRARSKIDAGARPHRGGRRPEGRQAHPDVRGDRRARHRRRAGEDGQRESPVSVGAPSRPGLFRPAARSARARDHHPRCRGRSARRLADQAGGRRKLYPAIRRVFDRARVILRDEHGIAMPKSGRVG